MGKNHQGIREVAVVVVVAEGLLAEITSLSSLKLSRDNKRHIVEVYPYHFP
jgi:hypothetical protein